MLGTQGNLGDLERLERAAARPRRAPVEAPAEAADATPAEAAPPAMPEIGTPPGSQPAWTVVPKTPALGLTSGIIGVGTPKT